MDEKTLAERREAAARALSTAYRHLARAETDTAKAQAEVKAARQAMLETLGLDADGADAGI